MESGDDGAFGVDFEEAAEILARFAASKSIGAQRGKTAGNPRCNLVRNQFDHVRHCDEHAAFLFEDGFDVGFLRRFAGMQHVPPFAAQRIGAELFVIGGAPDIGGNMVTLGQNLLGFQRAVDDRSAAKNVGLMFPAARSCLELVEALDDAFLRAGRHGGHGIILIVNGDVVKDVLTFHIHLFHAVLNDHGQFEVEGRIIRHHVRNRARHDEAVAVLMLQALAIQGRASAGAAHEKSPGSTVAGEPDLIANALETKHRVVDVEGNHGHAMIGVSRAGGDE